MLKYIILFIKSARKLFIIHKNIMMNAYSPQIYIQSFCLLEFTAKLQEGLCLHIK